MPVPGVDLAQGLIDFGDWVSTPFRMFTPAGRVADNAIDGYSIYKSLSTGTEDWWPKAVGMANSTVMERLLKPIGSTFAGNASAVWGKVTELATTGAVAADKKNAQPPGN